ncbi:MAG: GGDEF domain-containing protein [Actinomycetota bacterium]
MSPPPALEPPYAARKTSTPFRSALLTLTAGLVLTLAVAVMEQRSDERARELQFGREAEAIQQQLSARVEDLSDDFVNATHFIGATHPLPAEEYNDYFFRNLVFYNTVDPGVMFMEEVPRDAIDDLEARERRLGNDGFRVVDLGFGGPQALVVTRASSGDGNAFPIVGFDVSFARDMLLPEQVPTDGFTLLVAESSALMSGVMAGDPTGLDDETSNIPAASVFFVGRAYDAFDDPLGWAVRFLDPDHVTDGITIPAHVNVRLAAEAIENPIGVLPPQPGSTPAEALFYETRVVRTAGQPWTVEVWADPGYRDGIGVFTQTSQWAGGLAASALAAGAVGLWTYYRRRLAGASFELEHARTLANTDHLTGLLNRQGLVDGARHIPASAAASLYFVDLDGFKSVNDERGHEAGDAVLSAVGAALRKSFRNDDLIARLGGDEFVVFTAGRSAERETDPIAERVVRRIGAIDKQISCSVGVAHRPSGDGADVKDMLRTADKAMYSAKRNGGAGYVITNASDQSTDASDQSTDTPG